MPSLTGWTAARRRHKMRQSQIYHPRQLMRLTERTNTRLVLTHRQTAVRLFGLLFILLGLSGFAGGVYFLMGVSQLWLFPILCLLAATFGLALYIYAPQRTCVLDKATDRLLLIHDSLGRTDRYECRLNQVRNVLLYEWAQPNHTSALVRTRGGAGYAVVAILRDGAELTLSEITAEREKPERLAATIRAFLGLE